MRRRRHNTTGSVRRDWQPLVRVVRAPHSEGKIATQVEMARRLMPEISEARIREIIAEEMALDDMWSNDRYMVHVIRHKGGPNDCGIVQLSIRRQDRQPARDWRDFMRIKDQLVGAEYEGVELYPARSRVVDTANQFHLWCVNSPTYRWPVGYDAGRALLSSESGAGAVQRPLDDDMAATS